MKKKRISGNIIDYFLISDLPGSVAMCLLLSLLYWYRGKEDYYIFIYMALPLAILINIVRACLFASKKPKTLHIDNQRLYFGKDAVSPSNITAIRPFYKYMLRLPDLHWIEFKATENEKPVTYIIPTKPNSILRLNKESTTLVMLLGQFPTLKDKLAKESRA